MRAAPRGEAALIFCVRRFHMNGRNKAARILISLGALAVMLAFMGWFWGCGVVLSSALMILCGGLLFQNTAG
jgi:hypothetical protein